jgi:flagellar protein FlbD
VILLTRLNGQPVALNPDLIERAEATPDAPDTLVTLVDGTTYRVANSVEDVLARVREFRASVIALAQQFDPAPGDGPTLRVVPSPDGRD